MTESIADPEIARLQRRLERERRARQAAEQIAEAHTRVLWDQQQRLQLLQRVTETANAAASVHDAIVVALREICQYTHWPVGHAFLVESENRLSATGIWFVEPDEEFALLQHLSETTALRRGEGLPGRVLETGTPLWVGDLDADGNFPRKDRANGEPLGVRAAFAIPVHVAQELVAVLEFFNPAPAVKDDGWLELSTQIATQLSRVFERTRSAEAMRTAMEAAEAGNRAKSEFLATMSHEIRTPMNGVIGFTNLLLETALDSAQREYTTTIHRCGEALLTIINDILDFSKLEADKLSLEAMPLDLRETIEDVAALLMPNAESKGLEIVLHIAPDVPPAIVGDVGRLRQVLFNLAGNALKFTERGHIYLAVESARPRHDGIDRIRISVTDTGVGIPDDKQSLLFQKFSQADASTTRRFGGTGLGLAISKGLIERMGGDIGFTSRQGLGSTFWLELPAVHAERTPTTLPADDLQGARILIVDDLELNRRVLGTQLRHWNVPYDEAASGLEGLRLLREAAVSGRPYHIAILDFLMPGMDGEELGRLIRADARLQPVALIMLTSGAQRGDAERCLQAGFAAYLVKPVARPRLLHAALVRARERSLTAAASLPAAAPAPVPAPAACTRRVLLAEDNATNQRLASVLLRKLGCSVDVASDGREAVRLCSEGRYDCVFMDCQMPELDGFEAARAIRALETPGRRVPIIAQTANVMAEDRDRCLEAGMDDYISKPLSVADLKRMLAKWVSLDETGEAA